MYYFSRWGIIGLFQEEYERKTGGYEEAAEIFCSLANRWHVIFLTLGSNHSEGALNRQAMAHGRVAHASRPPPSQTELEFR